MTLAIAGTKTTGVVDAVLATMTVAETMIGIGTLAETMTADMAAVEITTEDMAAEGIMIGEVGTTIGGTDTRSQVTV